jgi:hypothetical protein
MKKLVVLLTLVAAVSAYSQGTVNFGNKVAQVLNPDGVTVKWAAVDQPYAYPTGGPAAAGKINGGITTPWGGSTAMIGLYGGTTGTAEGALELTLNGTVGAIGFRSGNAAGYITAASRIVDGTSPGGDAVVQIRIWDTGVAGSTLFNADGTIRSDAPSQYYWYKSPLYTVTGLGGGSPPATAATIVGLGAAGINSPISLTFVPEPSIIGLGILGAVAGLMVFRRRS